MMYIQKLHLSAVDMATDMVMDTAIDMDIMSADTEATDNMDIMAIMQRMIPSSNSANNEGKRYE